MKEVYQKKAAAGDEALQASRSPWERPALREPADRAKLGSTAEPGKGGTRATKDVSSETFFQKRH
jgi:hypothetical protein